jgi:hypothetical protein
VQGVACASAASWSQASPRVPTGAWGGEHVALTVTDTGAHFEFDCASGDIAKPLVVDDKGQFAMDGVFVQERGGALRPDDVPNKQAAQYAGQLTDKTLTLEVTLVDSKQKIGSYAVTLDATPRVRKCR